MKLANTFSFFFFFRLLLEEKQFTWPENPHFLLTWRLICMIQGSLGVLLCGNIQIMCFFALLSRPLHRKTASFCWSLEPERNTKSPKKNCKPGFSIYGIWYKNKCYSQMQTDFTVSQVSQNPKRSGDCKAFLGWLFVAKIIFSISFSCPDFCRFY